MPDTPAPDGEHVDRLPYVPAELLGAGRAVRRAGYTLVRRDAFARLRDRAARCEVELWAHNVAAEQACERLDWLIANGFGARTADLVWLRDTLRAPERHEGARTRPDATDGTDEATEGAP